MVSERILIVDDDLQVRYTCAQMLRKYNYYVDEIDNGFDALNKLRTEQYNLVITDLKMNKVDGLELIKKSKEIFSDLPFILITAYGTMDTAIQALRLGVYDFIIKPFTMDEFITTVNRCIEFHKLKQETLSLKETAALYELLHSVEKNKIEKEVLQNILEKALELISGNSGSIMLFNEDTNKLELVTHIGLKEQITREVSPGERVSGYVFNQREPMIINGELTNYPQFKYIESRPEIVSSISIPLISGNKVVGVMNINRIKPSAYKFTDIELNKIHFFISYVTNVIIQCQLYKKLINLDKLKSEFIANVNHELKTPLMVILGAIKLYDESNDAEREKLYVLLKKNVERMNLLITELLDYSNIETGKMVYKFKRVKLNNYIKKVVNEYKPKFASKKIEFKIHIPDTPIFINADIKRIQQCISNLLSNAIKFTKENGKVELTVEKSQDNVIISVEDNGKGIHKSEYNKIFDRFYQVDGSPTREHSGLGLGLTITKSIIESHNGKIWVESDLGHGSKFTISLPLDKAQKGE